MFHVGTWVLFLGYLGLLTLFARAIPMAKNDDSTQRANPLLAAGFLALTTIATLMPVITTARHVFETHGNLALTVDTVAGVVLGLLFSGLIRRLDPAG